MDWIEISFGFLSFPLHSVSGHHKKDNKTTTTGAISKIKTIITNNQSVWSLARVKDGGIEGMNNKKLVGLEGRLEEVVSCVYTISF